MSLKEYNFWWADRRSKVQENRAVKKGDKYVGNFEGILMV